MDELGDVHLAQRCIASVHSIQSTRTALLIGAYEHRRNSCPSKSLALQSRLSGFSEEFQRLYKAPPLSDTCGSDGFLQASDVFAPPIEEHWVGMCSVP